MLQFHLFSPSGNFRDKSRPTDLGVAGRGANCRIKPILILGENLYCEEINIVIDDRKVREIIQSSGLYTAGLRGGWGGGGRADGRRQGMITVECID